MKLKDLLFYIVDNVCIYETSAIGEHKNLYKGRLKDAPSKLLENDVKLIGANKNNLVDIEIKELYMAKE